MKKVILTTIKTILACSIALILTVAQTATPALAETQAETQAETATQRTDLSVTPDAESQAAEAQDALASQGSVSAWPQLTTDIEAEGACLMDARSGAVLYGKNMHESYYPASITKILTALLVIENCDNLDDTLTFSHRAVYDVEAGSSNAGYTEGDTVTVRTALYALLLASANEAANALAEYTAGSIEDFCVLMNARAQELGCTDTHFANPSGLNNENHYTSAYDFALICREAFKNDTFVQINGTTVYDLPPMQRQPDGFTIYAHHNMLKKSNPLYYEGIIGGKTGYTSLAGNTLVTCAERDGLKLITVVLNGHKTHYDDTKKMLDFGFENFLSLNPADYKTKYDTVFDSMDITGQGVLGADVISTSKTDYITLPKDADYNAVVTEVVYDLNENAPEEACAEIKYTYGDHSIGSQYVLRKYAYGETDIVVGDLIEEAEKTGDEAITVRARDYFLESPLWAKILMIVVSLAILAGIVALTVKLLTRRRRIEFHLTDNPGHSRKKK